MANMQKWAKVSLTNLVRHFERNEDINEYGNENINKELTKENYNLAPERENQLKFIKQRCSEVKCLKRDDVKVMCTWAVTLPKDIERDSVEEKRFFEESYKFLEERYGGAENVISAYVHKDEKTPHMHFAFVPVKFDENKQIYKVSAKEVVNRNDLKTFHNDLNAYISLKLGREVEIFNEATKEGNKSIQELKNGTAIKELIKIKEDLEDYRQIDEKIRDIDNIKVFKPKLGHKDKVLIDKTDLERLVDDSKKLNIIKKELPDINLANKKIDDLTSRLDNALSFENRIDTGLQKNIELLKIENLRLKELRSLSVDFINKIPKEIKEKLPIKELIKSDKEINEKDYKLDKQKVKSKEFDKESVAQNEIQNKTQINPKMLNKNSFSMVD
ncbi:MAG: MobV family relaxase [Sarcina sp.]